MNDEMSRRLVQAREETEATWAAVERAEKELRQASVTVVSRDHSVEVTVGPQGEVSALRFLDGRYRTMDADQLAASVLAAAREGRARMARSVMDALRPLESVSPALPDEHAAVPCFDIEWERIFGSLLVAAEGGAHPGSAGSELQDEIVEDSESG
ncbi:YbaB/EbfC family nucleoid-associated protein [Streptomyces sp. NPDC006654]|uniref:YbaB/EbfC family nucleoid-associated protein n=1 Tax=Streptomyces sp. NPDC006654 TaxID=3156897 RepID=UPI0033C6ABA1